MGKGGLILAGDIGGTKSWLGIYELKEDGLRLVMEEKYLNSDYTGIEGILEDFLDDADISGVVSASFGLACPVEEGRCKLTNTEWVIDGGELKRRFGFTKLGLINDIVAIAWGIGLLTRDDITVLNAGTPKEGNAALIAAGTGLGEALIFRTASVLYPSGSEGGHADFAPRNDLEIELLKYLSDIYGHVSYERVLSGPGLCNLYDFFKERNAYEEPGYLKRRFQEEKAPAVISDEAMNGEDMNCWDAMNLFVSIYGAEAGNLALKAFTSSGIYIGGGIAPRILKALKDGPFMDSFIDKGRFRDFLSNIPVYIILNEKAGLFGAANHAVSLMSEAGNLRALKIITPAEAS